MTSHKSELMTPPPQIPLTFDGNHGWSEGNAGLPYLALVLGCFIGFGSGLWGDRKYFAVQDANDGVAVPEYRLWGSMALSWLLPAGLLVFSFTQYAFVHWVRCGVPPKVA